MKRGVIVSLVTLAAISMANNRANSEGAVAEGIAPGGVAKGYSISMRTDRPDKDTARADALAGCRKGPEKTAAGAALDSGNAKARSRCEVVTSFSNKCAAVALDPKDGTPGAGWPPETPKKTPTMRRSRGVAMPPAPSGAPSAR
jgi:Domain of unknown function (DUF4189)